MKTFFLCIGGNFCEVCVISMKWPDIKHMPLGPLGRRRRLNSISNFLVNAEMPPINYKPREKKREENLLNTVFQTGI